MHTVFHRQKHRWLKTVVCMAVLVMFCTVNVLAPYASQMDEGQQTAACRKLICSPERLQIHEHTDDCRDENGELICGYADFVVHTHNADCYDESGELCCPLPEIQAHTHTDSCYTDQSSEPVCGKEEIILHEHDKDCFNEDGQLICGKTQILEHVHSEDCFQTVEETVQEEDTTATEESSVEPETDPTEARINENTEETEVTEDPVNEPETDKESEKTQETQVTEEKTEEPAADGTVTDTVSLDDTFHYEDENISVALHISGEAFLEGELEQTDQETRETLETAGTESEEPGTETEEYTGTGSETEETAIEEDTVTEPETDKSELGTEEKQETEEIPAAEESLPAQDADTTQVTSDTTEELVMAVAELGEEQPEYQAAREYAKEQEVEDNIVGISAMDFAFNYQGCSLDVSKCTLTAEITPTEKLQEAADQVESSEAEEIVSEAEVGIELTLLQSNEDQTEVLDNALVEKDEEESPVLSVTLNSADPQIQVLAQETANPHFTVQYYAWLPRVQYGDNGQLTIINTDNGGTGAGGNLPQNGNNGVTSTMNLELTATGTAGVYGVTTENELEEVYAAHSYEYVSAPNLTYFNRLYENGNYSLSKVWVLKDGKSATSTEETDWDVYDIDKVHFTNRPQSAENPDANGDGIVTLLITDNTVIRLVYDTTSNSYNNAVSFYDYDITEDGKTTWDANGDKGINNPSNYTYRQQGEAKLAFGNANTGVSLQDDLWRGNQLNQYNRSGNGYLGGTYGLATGLDSEGHIQYADDVSVPNLFNDGSANGKTSYDNGQYSLNFNRAGDTYTLTSVQGAGENADNLQYFNHPVAGDANKGQPYTHIWTNNFWPMDGVTNTDPHTGYDHGGTVPRGQYVGFKGQDTYPPSDDGVAHNNMFGMTYTVNFNLVEDYSGPLEYLFFGDDDMWVFLTDPNGNSRLVCDIGGVHSTVGEYVNLWDYIARTTDSETGAQTVTTPGSYKLTFFYTERGLSGSSCYMQFTLPSVSSVTPEQNTSQLKVQKVVTGGTQEQNNTDEFNFTIKLTDASGNNLLDDYAYTRYAADGTEIATDLITFDGGTFSLKNGEYIIIRYLPYGTKYTITENGTGDPNVSLGGKYTVSGTVNAGGSSESVPFTGVTASGQIQEGQNGEVIYTNALNPKLPDTGGPGTYMYTSGGIALLVLSLVYRVFSRRSRKSGL